MQSAVVGRYSKDGVGVIGTGFAECFWSLPRRPGGVGSENTTAEAPADESADLICNLPKINVLLILLTPGKS